MWLGTNVLLLCMFFLVQAGRFNKKQGVRNFRNYNLRRNLSTNFGLWPSSFNLATKALISTNSTCGENGREEFCRMVEGGKGRCGICDNYSSDPSKKHLIGYAIDGSSRWWQSPALFYGTEYELVTVVVDLKQTYQITDVIIKSANSLRPGTWILERSLNGEDYDPWQYFARSDKECLDRFGIPGTKGKPHYFTDSEVICTAFYSKLTPMENGEIHTSLINGRPGANETSPELLEFTKARYVRLRLMGLRGTVEPLPRWLMQDVFREKRLYYTIRDISVIGHCVCNGHAENCRHNVASGHPECECAHHTCGPNCNRCCPMYNQRKWSPGSSRDAHQCLPCNCHGRAEACHYDENVDKAGLSMDVNGNYQGGGVCDNCTAHTDGINCERCQPGYYTPTGTDPYSEKPCVRCDCDYPGSSGSCDQDGRCDCLFGYEGDKCENCSPGFKNWPKCESCLCDARGTSQMTDCEKNCTCKANVYGKLCDRCKSGYFALTTADPNGCTECYCSGVTTLCQSALITPIKVQTLENWLTTDLKISVIAKPIWDSKGLFSIGNYELPHTEFLYWLAPAAYLGNKLEYYSSVLTFKVHWVIMRGDTSGRPTTGPNIIIVGGNGVKIARGNGSFINSNATFHIPMKEVGWYHIPSDVDELSKRMKRNNYVGEPVNRKEFLRVLSNVSHVLLRATFHTDQIESLLEEATLHSSGSPDVEKCSCPSGYSGFSCESCAFGYVRIKTNTSESYCGKCDCNGHSETCNPDTGECTCLHSTTGENCERCKPGFYGNPLKGTGRDCRKCACPLENDENNFSPSCQLDYLRDEGGYVCTQCPKGYTGDHCEICDDGYFGDPMVPGNICKPCSCNGGPCDKTTGQCLSCKGNTEGWRCEKCKSGYYGDALMSNCIACQCDPIGAISRNCDLESGQCECKDRFMGRTCNKCEVGYGNVTASCIKCACNAMGSKSQICDQHTGLCECKRGVDGFHCDTCLGLHYGLSEEGCEECHCDKHGSKIQDCDQTTGKCICKPHFSGPKCDRCEAGYWKSKFVCKPCNCNYNGSINLNCDPETGTCPCKVGVQGQRCDSCQDKHYGNVTMGCRACDPCEKEGHICHLETGKCVCPTLSRGPKCELCVDNTWGHEPGIGCKMCGCSPTGGSHPQCDAVSGRCTCKLGFEGEKCDKCSFGYHNYPNCHKCNCDVAGTVPEDCSHGTCKCTETGCRCKENVKGHRCDQCKKGTFGMDPDHPQGCTNCFCSSRSSTCQASSQIWHQIRTNNLKSPTLPEKFLGDLIYSYGGYLRISSNSPRNFVYLTGNGITLESISDPRGDIKMTESFWKLRSGSRVPPECTHPLLPRSCLMIVLQNVTRIQIDAPSQQIKLSEVLLDKLSNTPGIPQAKSVEQCTCPKNYASSSCQDPNTGYYRFYPEKSDPTYGYIDKIIGVAKPCRCNNKSNVCDKETGYCLNCSDFTTGPHCESCAQGYYGDSLGNCSPCLCPTEGQNFARNCTVFGSPKQFICACKAGYSGPKCERCEDNYWGNPRERGGSCQPCNCNPDGSEDLRCDKRTGQCKCKPNFLGEKCSQCSSARQVLQNGVCAPCDECTQILFNTLDDLSDGLDNTLDLFKNGLGPPWSKLNSTVHQYHLISNKFENIERTKKIIDDGNIEELEKRIDTMKRSLPTRNKILSSQRQLINDMGTESANLSQTVKELNAKINNVTDNINNFGKKHINVKEALREAEELLNDIVEISTQAPKSKYYEDFFNKCQKFAEDVDGIYKDDVNFNRTKTELDDLTKRMNDLNEVLNKIDLRNKLTNNKNRRNSNRIKVLKQNINRIDDKNSVINSNISELLDKIKVTNDLLNETKGIYDLLFKINLKEAIEDLEKDDIDEIYNTLSEVREHVQNIQNKVNTYKNLFNFTSEEWKKIDASGAYNKIVKGIESATKEAEQARNTTINALNKLYPSDSDSLSDRTNLAKAFSDRIQKRIENLENLAKDFKKTTEELDSIKYEILHNGKNNNDLNSVLRQTLNDAQQQTKLLERAKNNGRNGSTLIDSLDKGVKDLNITMQYDLKKTYHRYLDLVSHNKITDLSNTIDKTKKDLDEITIRLNFTKIDKVEQANRQQFNATNEKIKDLQKQIKNLTNLIKSANEYVETVEVGVDIVDCERQYKLETDLLRSLEVHFKCKNVNSCVLLNLYDHNNETIRIRYENNETVIEWNNQSIITKGNVSLSKTDSTLRAENQIRGSITNFKPFYFDRLQIGNLSEKNEGEACVHKVILNRESIGLWKFSKSEGNCKGCRGTNSELLEDAFFTGDGYRQIVPASIRDLNPGQLSFRCTFATFDENSLIFLSQDKQNHSSFIALTLKDGKLQFDVQHNNGLRVNLVSKKRYNTGEDVTVEIGMEYTRSNEMQNYVVQAGDERIPKVEPLNKAHVFRIKKSDFIIGGVPSLFNSSSIPINITPFLGNLKMFVKGVPVTQGNSMSYNIEPRLKKLEFYKAWFPGKGYLKLEHPNFGTNSEIAFMFEPLNVANNFIMKINNNVELYLYDSTLIMKINSEELKVGPVYVNSSHFVRINSISITLNDKNQTNFSTPIGFTDGKIQFYLGSDESKKIGSFTGTISDIFLGDKPLVFDSTTVKSFHNVEIGRDRLTTTPPKNESTKEMQNTERYFHRPVYKTEPQAFKFGDKPNSFVLIKNTFVGKKFLLEFQFRTFYPNGLLFYSTFNSLHHNTTFYTVLEIQGGDIQLRVQSHKTKPMNIKNKINDGGWHHVQVEQLVGKKKSRFVVKVDKKWKIKARIPKNNFNGDLYLGGIANTFPVHKKLKNELHPFRGCIRSFKINKNLQVVKNNNNVFYSNIGQCFQKVEEGAYFGGDAYAVYKHGFKVNKFLELSFEFKTAEPNGVLLSVSNFGNSPALSVELQNGAVVMTIDMGNGIVSQVTNSPRSNSALANNEWHNITALYSSSELTVNVDGVRKSWVQSDINSMMDEIEAPLYVGGLPSNAPSGTLKIKENFRGCIRKFKIEDNIMDWTDMKELINVQLNSCLA